MKICINNFVFHILELNIVIVIIAFMSIVVFVDKMTYLIHIRYHETNIARHINVNTPYSFPTNVSSADNDKITNLSTGLEPVMSRIRWPLQY